MHKSRVDAPVMRHLKFLYFKNNTLKLQAVSHNTICLIIPAPTLHIKMHEKHR